MCVAGKTVIGENSLFSSTFSPFNCHAPITTYNEQEKNTFSTFFLRRMFESLEKLANHVSMAHSSIGYNNLYYCKWEGCQRSERGFNARYKMLVHCRTHTKEKPHFCTYQGCSKAFSRAENLKIHFR